MTAMDRLPWILITGSSVGIVGILVQELQVDFALVGHAFEHLGSFLLEALAMDVVSFALPVAFSRWAIPATDGEPCWITILCSLMVGLAAIVTARRRAEDPEQDFAPMFAVQTFTYVAPRQLFDFATDLSAEHLLKLFGSTGVVAGVGWLARCTWETQLQAVRLLFCMAVGTLGWRMPEAFARLLKMGEITKAFKAIGAIMGLIFGASLAMPLLDTTPILQTTAMTLFPLAELHEAYFAMEGFVSKERLWKHSVELFIVTANIQIAIGFLGIAQLRNIQQRKNALLEVGSPHLDAHGYVRRVLWYMGMAALPYMLQRTAMESVNSYAFSRWQYDMELGVRIGAFFPESNADGGRMLLAAVAESNFTVEGYASAISAIGATSYGIVERKLFSLPKLALIPGMLMSQPVLVATALPAAIALDLARANVMSRLTKILERIRRQQQEWANKRKKIEQHDTKNEELIRRGGFIGLTASHWREVSAKLRLLQIQFDTLSLFKSFINGLYTADFVAPGIECVLAFLLEIRHIGVSDLWVYTRVVEDAIDMLLTRPRQEATLAHMQTHIDRLNQLTEQLNNTLARGSVRCSKSASGDLQMRAVEYRRGSSLVQIPELTLETGRVYAVTGANGCGKSTLFSLFASCAHEGFILPSGLQVLAVGELSLPSFDLVEITQQLYCPLYTKPIKWMTRSFDADVLPKEKVREIEERIVSLSAELNFYNSSAGLSAEVLHATKDDWYQELSGGQKCKVEFIRSVFLQEICPRIILIDEAFAPLDPVSKMLVQRKLKEHCRESVIMVIHHMDADGNCVPKGGFFDDTLHFANGTARLVGTCD